MNATKTNYGAQFKAHYDTMDVIRQRDPELYRAAVPRRYVPPAGYANPKVYAPTLCVPLSPHDSSEGLQVIDVLGMGLLRRGVPTYFVGEEFIRAVAATSPPEDMTLGELKLGIDAALYMLPLAFMEEYLGGGGVAPCVAVVDAAVGRHTTVLLGKGGREVPWHRAGSAGVVIEEEPRVLLHTPVFWPGAGAAVDYSHVAKHSKTIREVVEVGEFTTYDQEAGKYVLFELAPVDKQREMAVAKKMNSLAIKLAMAVSARPDLVEHGDCCRHQKVSKGGVEQKEELWNPNFVGRTYVARREWQGGTHQSPRMHWRRGHFHTVRHGKGRALSRIDWFEAVLVAGDEQEQPTTIQPKGTT